MKTILQVLLLATVSAVTLNQPEALATTEAFDENAARWKNDWDQYRAERDVGDGNNCRLRESWNFLGAQQCKYGWECRGARVCERGGWCDGYDGCKGTAFPYQAPGLQPDN